MTIKFRNEYVAVNYEPENYFYCVFCGYRFYSYDWKEHFKEKHSDRISDFEYNEWMW